VSSWRPQSRQDDAPHSLNHGENRPAFANPHVEVALSITWSAPLVGATFRIGRGVVASHELLDFGLHQGRPRTAVSRTPPL